MTTATFCVTNNVELGRKRSNDSKKEVVLPIHRWLAIALLITLLAVSIAPAFAQAEAGALSATPTPTSDAILFDISLASLPSPPATIGIARLLFPVGSTILGGSINGPRFFWVKSGSFSVWLDAPGVVWKERDRDRSVEVGAGEFVQLDQDDLLIVHDRPPFELTNSSTEPATLLDIVIWPAIEQRIRPFVTDAGVIFEPLVVGEANHLPVSPARLVLRYFSLPTSGAAKFVLDQGPQLLFIESGSAGLLAGDGDIHFSSAASNAPGSITGSLKPLPPGSEIRLNASGSAVMQQSATGTLRNLGRTDLHVLELSLVTAELVK